MNEQITSAAELDALTDLVVRLNRANKGLLSQSRTSITSERTRLEGKAEGVRLALSYVEEAIRARRDQPQRVQPSAERVRRAIRSAVQAEHDGAGFGGRVVLNDWETACDDGSMADAVLALFAQQPTAAEVKAEALREAGKWFLLASQLGTGERDEIAAQACFDRADRIEREARS